MLRRFALPFRQRVLQDLSLAMPSQFGGVPQNPQQQQGLQQQQMQDTPIADPIDTIAQMLQLDLSSATSPDQQAQLVVNAVEALVLKLHQNYNEQDGQDSEGQDDFSSDVDDQQGPEVDANGDPVEEEPEVDANGDPIEYDDEPPEDAEDDPADNVPPKRQPIAASNDFVSTISPAMLSMAKGGRKAEIAELVRDCYLTPHAAKLWLSRYCNDNALALALSNDADVVEDSFESAVELLKANGKVLEMGEKTGAQSKFSKLSPDGTTHSMTEDEIQSDANPMVAEATRRAAEFAEKQRNSSR